MTNSPEPLSHVCGQCSQTFASEAAYIKHACPIQTSKSPTQAIKTTKINQDDLLAAVKNARKALKSHV